MTIPTELMESARIQAAIAKAETEHAELTEALDILEDEQRKAATLATVGLLSESKAARLQEIPGEIVAAKARRDQLTAGIEGARELLATALAEEATAQAKADWDEAEALLEQAGEVARAAQEALKEVGLHYAEVNRLLEEAARLAKPHVAITSRSLLDHDRLDLSALFGLVLRDSGGPDFQCRVSYAPHPGPVPTIGSVIARHAASFLEWRNR